MSKILITQEQFDDMVHEYAIKARGKYKYMRLGQALLNMLAERISPGHSDADIYYLHNDEKAYNDFIEKYVEKE